MLRCLDKERYLVRLGWKARSTLEEPFKDHEHEFENIKEKYTDHEGAIDGMFFDDYYDLGEY